MNCKIYNESRSHLRNQEALMIQLKNDYAQCQKLWTKIWNSSVNISEAEKIIQINAWIKSEIKEIEKISTSTIEGTSVKEISGIKKEINSIQHKIKIKMMESISIEMDS